MLWIFSALCKAVWLTWNALSNTGMYTGIKSHSRTDLTPNMAHSAGEAAALAGAAPVPLCRELHRPLLLAVGSVGADLHQGPGKARPLVVVWHSQLQDKPARMNSDTATCRTGSHPDPKLRYLLWGELLLQSAGLVHSEAPWHVHHQPAGGWLLGTVAKFTWHTWQFPIQWAFSQRQSKRLYLLDFVVLLQNLPLG